MLFQNETRTVSIASFFSLDEAKIRLSQFLGDGTAGPLNTPYVDGAVSDDNVEFSSRLDPRFEVLFSGILKEEKGKLALEGELLSSMPPRYRILFGISFLFLVLLFLSLTMLGWSYVGVIQVIGFSTILFIAYTSVKQTREKALTLIAERLTNLFKAGENKREVLSDAV